ncbi:hypothetical protein [Pontibacter sp. G13]|uniref:hypothetical protein n=1 Tax=Pontibacter sp. G13 TaxID=3074898 RepID=UPI00288BFD71|nr:hypothetical protein [Pontibacter sp. G13]WNJ16511.1 hypothetical protein RJD25_16720 [Pontibacter sp. G13]
MAVEQFIRDFHTRREQQGICYLNRDEQIRLMLETEMTASKRNFLIANLEEADYLEGPLVSIEMPEMKWWEFEVAFRHHRLIIRVGILDSLTPAICQGIRKAKR